MTQRKNCCRSQDVEILILKSLKAWPDDEDKSVLFSAQANGASWISRGSKFARSIAKALITRKVAVIKNINVAQFTSSPVTTHAVTKSAPDDESAHKLQRPHIHARV